MAPQSPPRRGLLLAGLAVRELAYPPPSRSLNVTAGQPSNRASERERRAIDAAAGSTPLDRACPARAGCRRRGRGRGTGHPAVTCADEVLAAARELIGAFGRHDTAAYFRCFATDATFIFPNAPARLTSRAEYQRLWQHWELQDDFRVLSCVSRQPLVQDFGDVAVFSHEVTTVIRARAGRETLRERETIVFRRDSGRWLAVHEHLSPRP